MAKTYTYGDALNYVQQSNPRAKNDVFGAFGTNVATNYLWLRANWRESISPLPPFYLYPGEQEFGSPATVIPSDFHGLREVYLNNLRADIDREPLGIQSNIDITARFGLPKKICYAPATNTFRVWPRVPLGIGATQYTIDGTYKKRAPKVTTSQVNSPLPWDDEYFQVYCACLHWALLPEGKSKNEALQMSEMYIDRMIVEEGLEEGDPSIAPNEPLIIRGF